MSGDPAPRVGNNPVICQSSVVHFPRPSSARARQINASSVASRPGRKQADGPPAWGYFGFGSLIFDGRLVKGGVQDKSKNGCGKQDGQLLTASACAALRRDDERMIGVERGDTNNGQMVDPASGWGPGMPPRRRLFGNERIMRRS